MYQYHRGNTGIVRPRAAADKGQAVLYLWAIREDMLHPNFRMIRAVGVMVGSIVGAGVFGLPYAFAQSGAGIGAAWLLGIGAVVLLLFLMYAEVVIQTPGTHRLGGYAEIYIGPAWKSFATILLGAAQLGAMLAYTVLGGRFLLALFGPLFGGTELVYALLMVAGVAAFTWRGTKFATRAESAVVGVLLFLFVWAILASVPAISAANLFTLQWDAAFLPYGVVLFALSGIGAVPEMKEALGSKDLRRLPHAVTYGLFVLVGLYLAFSLAVVGVTGTATTPTAFTGLSDALGPVFQAISALLGSVTIFSIFAMTCLQVQNALAVDLRVPRRASWALAAFVPPTLYLAGLREFIGVIGFVGAVFSGIVGMLVVALYERMRRSPVCREHKCLNVPTILAVLVAGLFAWGVLRELAEFLL